MLNNSQHLMNLQNTLQHFPMLECRYEQQLINRVGVISFLSNDGRVIEFEWANHLPIVTVKRDAKTKLRIRPEYLPYELFLVRSFQQLSIFIKDTVLYLRQVGKDNLRLHIHRPLKGGANHLDEVRTIPSLLELAPTSEDFQVGSHENEERLQEILSERGIIAVNNAGEGLDSLIIALLQHGRGCYQLESIPDLESIKGILCDPDDSDKDNAKAILKYIKRTCKHPLKLTIIQTDSSGNPAISTQTQLEEFKHHIVIWKRREKYFTLIPSTFYSSILLASSAATSSSSSHSSNTPSSSSSRADKSQASQSKSTEPTTSYRGAVVVIREALLALANPILYQEIMDALQTIIHNRPIDSQTGFIDFLDNIHMPLEMCQHFDTLNKTWREECQSLTSAEQLLKKEEELITDLTALIKTSKSSIQPWPELSTLLSLSEVKKIDNTFIKDMIVQMASEKFLETAMIQQFTTNIPKAIQNAGGDLSALTTLLKKQKTNLHTIISQVVKKIPKQRERAPIVPLKDARNEYPHVGSKHELKTSIVRKQIQEARDHLHGILVDPNNRSICELLIEGYISTNLEKVPYNPHTDSVLRLTEKLRSLVNLYDKLDEVKTEQELLAQVVRHVTYTIVTGRSHASSIATTMSLISAAFEHIEKMKGKESILFIGDIRSGKSTSVNYFRGLELEHDFNFIDDEIYRMKKKKPELSSYPHNSHDVEVAQNVYVQGYTSPYLDSSLILGDCPAFHNIRKHDDELCVNISIDQTIRVLKQIKSIVIVVPFNSFMIDNGNPIIQLMASLEEWFPTFLKAEFPSENNFFILITKSKYFPSEIVDELKDGTKFTTLIESMNNQLCNSSQDYHHLQNLEKRKKVWQGLKQMLDSKRVDFIDLEDTAARQELLEKYSHSPIGIDKNRYQSLMGNPNMQFKLHSYFEESLHIWLRILRNYFINVPENITASEQIIHYEEVQIMAAEKDRNQLLTSIKILEEKVHVLTEWLEELETIQRKNQPYSFSPRLQKRFNQIMHEMNKVLITELQSEIQDLNSEIIRQEAQRDLCREEISRLRVIIQEQEMDLDRLNTEELERLPESVRTWPFSSSILTEPDIQIISPTASRERHLALNEINRTTAFQDHFDENARWISSQIRANKQKAKELKLRLENQEIILIGRAIELLSSSTQEKLERTSEELRQKVSDQSIERRMDDYRMKIDLEKNKILQYRKNKQKLTMIIKTRQDVLHLIRKLIDLIREERNPTSLNSSKSPSSSPISIFESEIWSRLDGECCEFVEIYDRYETEIKRIIDSDLSTEMDSQTSQTCSSSSSSSSQSPWRSPT